MIDSRKVAVVIQGPMVSSGNSGSGAQASSFDCNANVLRLIASARGLADGFILSTWEAQTVSVRDDRLQTLHLRDPGPQKIFFSSAPGNELRQAFGCLEGVRKAISAHRPDYILRARTDQYVDLALLIEHMVRVDESHQDYLAAGQSGFIFMPNMLAWSPYSVGDFFIGGHAADLEAFFAAQVRYAKHTFVGAMPWVHSDIMLRHAYANLRDSFDQLPQRCFFPNLASALRLDEQPPPPGFRYHPEILRLWEEMLRKSISLFPRSATEGLEWRGARLVIDRHSIGEFYEEWLEARTGVKAWMRRLQPALYDSDAPPGSLDLFLNFCAEKQLEIDTGRPVWRCHFARTARTLVSLLTARMPRNDLALRLWSRWQQRTTK